MSDQQATKTRMILEADMVVATVELFDSHGINVTHDAGMPPCVTPRSSGEMALAVIGYAGDAARGSLSMLAREEVVQSWQSAFDPVGSLGAQDVLGEFSNMLLGRFKYGLMARGVTVLVATPSTASGSNLVLRPASGLASRWYEFECPGGSFYVRLDATFESGFSLEAKPAIESCAAAGDMMLF